MGDGGWEWLQAACIRSVVKFSEVLRPDQFRAPNCVEVDEAVAAGRIWRLERHIVEEHQVSLAYGGRSGRGEQQKGKADA